MSAFTHTFSPADTWDFPAALANIFSVSVISRDAQCKHAARPLQVEHTPIHTLGSSFQLPLNQAMEPLFCCPAWDGKAASEILGSGAVFFFQLFDPFPSVARLIRNGE
jgi:hypothetical protein